jgi:cytochrome o ubiquinol oxidase subunit 2
MEDMMYHSGHGKQDADSADGHDAHAGHDAHGGHHE